MWSWLRLGRRRYAIPDRIRTEALHHIPYAATLPAADQERLRALVLRFLHPYCFGHMGAVQPRSAMRSSQSFTSGFSIRIFVLPVAIWPGPRAPGGQLASSQVRASWRKASSETRHLP